MNKNRMPRLSWIAVLLALLVLQEVRAAQPITAGLVGYWRLDEIVGSTATDSSGFGRDGAVAPVYFAGNGPDSSDPAPLGFDNPTCRLFNGVEGRIDIVPANAFAGATNTFSMAFWAKPTMTQIASTESTTGSVTPEWGAFQRYALAPDDGSALYGASTHACAGVSVSTDGVSVFERGAGAWPSVLVHREALQGWTHVTVVYQDRQPRLYLNGVLARTGLAGPRTVHPPSRIGGISENSFGSYGGALDDMRIYDRALTTNEISALAAGHEQADYGPPGPVTVSASAAGGHSIRLSWTTPANDGTTAASGSASVYDLRCSTAGPIDSDAAFDAATKVTLPFLPGPPGAPQSWTVGGLAPHTAHHWCLKTGDEAGSWSPRSPDAVATTASDAVPPAAVEDLAASGGEGLSIRIEWTAPADDGADASTGRVAGYDLRRSTAGPILDDAAFAEAAPVPVTLAPGSPGSRESMVVDGLLQDTRFFFAIRSVDRQPAWSALSNSPVMGTGFTGSTGVASPCGASATGLSCLVAMLLPVLQARRR